MIGDYVLSAHSPTQEKIGNDYFWDLRDYGVNPTSVARNTLHAFGLNSKHRSTSWNPEHLTEDDVVYILNMTQYPLFIPFKGKPEQCMDFYYQAQNLSRSGMRRDNNYRDDSFMNETTEDSVVFIDNTDYNPRPQNNSNDSHNKNYYPDEKFYAVFGASAVIVLIAFAIMKFGFGWGWIISIVLGVVVFGLAVSVIDTHFDKK